MRTIDRRDPLSTDANKRADVYVCRYYWGYTLSKEATLDFPIHFSQESLISAICFGAVDKNEALVWGNNSTGWMTTERGDLLRLEDARIKSTVKDDELGASVGAETPTDAGTHLGLLLLHYTSRKWPGDPGTFIFRVGTREVV